MTPSAADDLDTCEYLYLEEISEPHANGLRLVVSEGIVAARTETFSVGDVEIRDLHPIEVTDASKWFEVLWESYIAYSVRDESFCSWDDYEARSGKALQTFTKSRFLDYVAVGTNADDDHPGPFVHYGICCSDHVVDVASASPPTVRRIDAPRSKTRLLPWTWFGRR